MNRRKFLTNLGKLGVFTILPGAGRVWKAQRDLRYITNPDYVNAEYGIYFIDYGPILGLKPTELSDVIPVIFRFKHAPILPHISEGRWHQNLPAGGDQAPRYDRRRWLRW